MRNWRLANLIDLFDLDGTAITNGVGLTSATLEPLLDAETVAHLLSASTRGNDPQRLCANAVKRDR